MFVLLHIFVETNILFQEFLMIRKFKGAMFIKNSILYRKCNVSIIKKTRLLKPSPKTSKQILK